MVRGIHRVASSGFWAGIPTRGSLGDIYRTRFDPAEHSNVRTGFDPTALGCTPVVLPISSHTLTGCKDCTRKLTSGIINDTIKLTRFSLCRRLWMFNRWELFEGIV